MKFKTDENLPTEAAERLREAGFDAESVAEEQLSGTPDPELMEACIREGRALVTLDMGFADIRAYQPSNLPGIVVLRPRSQSKASVLDLIRRIQPLLRTEPVAGKLWVVDEKRARIRD